MREAPVITKVEAIHFEHVLENVGKDYNTFNMVFEPGGSLVQSNTILRIHTDKGIVGEYPGVIGPAMAELRAIGNYLVGKNSLARESIYNDLKRGSRHWAMLGMSVVDICLWDIAGKFYDDPLYRLLGGERRPLKAYASNSKYFISDVVLSCDGAGNSATPVILLFSPNRRNCQTIDLSGFSSIGKDPLRLGKGW